MGSKSDPTWGQKAIQVAQKAIQLGQKEIQQQANPNQHKEIDPT